MRKGRPYGDKTREEDAAYQPNSITLVYTVHWISHVLILLRKQMCYGYSASFLLGSVPL